MQVFVQACMAGTWFSLAANNIAGRWRAARCLLFSVEWYLWAPTNVLLILWHAKSMTWLQPLPLTHLAATRHCWRSSWIVDWWPWCCHVACSITTPEFSLAKCILFHLCGFASQQVAVEASPAVASSWQFCSRVSWSITACSKFLTVCFYSSGWSYDVVGHETVCHAITNFFSSVNAALIWKYFLLPCHLLVSNHFCTMAQPGRLLLCSLKFDRPQSAFAI